MMQLREASREMWGFRWAVALWRDLRYGLRMLRRSPVFTVVAVLSLALGIGANTAIFSLLDQVLFRLLPVREPDLLVVFHVEGESAPGWSLSDNSQTVFSYPMYKDLRDRSAVFGGVIARSSAPVSVSYEGQTERASAELVSGNFFGELGVQAALGRTLAPEDDEAPGAHPVVVLSYGYWTRRFGGSAAILNTKVNLNGHPMIVLGVAAPGFRSLISGQAPDVLVPIAMKREITPTWDGLDDRRIRWLNIFGRLKPGVSRPQAEAGVQTAYRPILEDELGQLGRLRTKRAEEQFLAQRLELRAASQGINQLRLEWQAPLVALMAIVGLVLLIACGNVANLLLARAVGRQRETAIRLALGAGRATIVRQLLVESLVVALAGGLVGLLVAGWTTGALLGFLPAGEAGHWLSSQLDLRVLAFTLLLSVATGLLFGLAPAIQATRADVAPALKGQPGSFASASGPARLRRTLVVAQIALSLILVVGSGLFARSLYNLRHVNPGFRAEQLMTFAVDPRLNGYDAAHGYVFYRELQERLAALPGVRAAGAANPGPLTNNDRGGNLTVEGYQPKEGEEPDSKLSGVGPGYFQALGMPVLVGREFTERDLAGPKVVVVNEAFAKQYFGAQNPLGRRLAFGSANRITLDREIVGVVGNHKHDNLREAARRFVFFPYTQDERLDRLSFYVRAERSASELGPEIRRIVREMDANLPVFDMKSMQVRVEESIYADRLIAVLAGAFGLLATLLAAMGLYGVVAYMVARRTAEIGIRMALGAMPGDVLWLVMKDVARLALGGIAIGLPTALALGRLVESQLFGLKAHDPLIFTGAACLLALVAMLSGYIPGRRAARIDPMNALRYE
ncbi:MAG: ABC transporter permease [Acidobacteria bacterium]|nr:ABC transporter permease [Acidobacteriota bacterium]